MVLNTIGKVRIVNKYYQYYCLDFISSRPVSLCAIPQWKKKTQDLIVDHIVSD